MRTLPVFSQATSPGPERIVLLKDLDLWLGIRLKSRAERRVASCWGFRSPCSGLDLPPTKSLLDDQVTKKSNKSSTSKYTVDAFVLSIHVKQAAHRYHDDSLNSALRDCPSERQHLPHLLQSTHLQPMSSICGSQRIHGICHASKSRRASVNPISFNGRIVYFPQPHHGSSVPVTLEFLHTASLNLHPTPRSSLHHRATVFVPSHLYSHRLPLNLTP
jgi:hypothetical protein